MDANEKPSLRLILAISGGILLGLAFPPFHLGWLAFFSLVPLLRLMDLLNSYGKIIRFGYLMFFVLNLVTLYWAGGFFAAKDWYMMVGGALLLLVHPFFVCLPLVVFIPIRRKFNLPTALVSFPFIWTAFEYLHSATQISFPWLVLANTQTYDLAAVQITSLAGAYGLSFWIVLTNVGIYLLSREIISGRRAIMSPLVISSLALLTLLYLGVEWYGNRRLSDLEPDDTGRVVRVGVIQPNIDPFEKWQDNPDSSLSILSGMTKQVAGRPVDLIIWPETAVPCYLLHPSNQYYYAAVRHVVDSVNTALLTGIPDIIYYRGNGKIPKSSKRSLTGEYYETFNSSLLLEPGNSTLQKYAKIRLVPFAERVPFSEELSFLNAMKWNFGLGGWGIGKDTTVFRYLLRDGREVRFSNLICYESIYPGFVAAFVRRGAEFLTVITNDSWWGNTSGAYQHEQYAVLRAVENHRWIIQCANGGISCAVDPYGRIVTSTKIFTKAILTQEIALRDDQTFYTEHGDWFAELSVVVAGFILMSALGTQLYISLRRRQLDEVH